MFRKRLFLKLLFISIVHFSSDQLYAQEEEGEIIIFSERGSQEIDKEKKIYFTLRLGQGGFYDDRSPIGKLGGGQLALDIKPSKFPIAISISNEYYTNSADPIHSYEIANLTAINILYMAKPFKSERVNVFLGGGIGGLKVPKGENEPNAMVKGILYNFEGGINVRLFWKIGFYGIGKYLYAQKKNNSIQVIDFRERIVLLGFTLNFGL